MFIGEAVAQTAEASAQAQGGYMQLFVNLLLVFGIFYLLLLRPQQKKIKRHEALLNAIVKGTKVVVGGIEGTVVRVIDADKVVVEIAPDVCITVIRGYISAVVLPGKDK